jgi:hypothetical protein
MVNKKQPADLYWHLLPADKKLRFGDSRLVRTGRTIKVKCQPILCHAGLHACRRPIDALQYAPGPIICRVTLGGTILHGSDKSVGTERTVLWMADATNTLHRFACAVAEESLKTAKVEDERCYNAIRVKLRWLEGNATDEELASASASARGAARGAAWASARASASASARGAARGAARDAARSAAWDAAWACASARGAAWDAAWAAQNRRLESMLLELESKK